MSQPSLSSPTILIATMTSVPPRRREFHLEIENYHPGAEDTQRTRFIVRGETVDEVLQNIIDNTQVSFSSNEAMFRKTAHLYDRRSNALGRQELLPGSPMPAGLEFIFLYFRPSTP